VADEVEFTQPLVVEPPAAARVRWFRRTRYRLVAWVLGDESPTPGNYRRLVDEVAAQGAVILSLQSQLAAARAERDAAVREVELLSKVTARDRERFEADTAAASASRERSINESNAARSLRQAAS